jgi:hypothetical protein
VLDRWFVPPKWQVAYSPDHALRSALVLVLAFRRGSHDLLLAWSASHRLG